MVGYPPQAQAWIRQQFDVCVNGAMDALALDTEQRFAFRALIERDNWIAQDNPFREA